MENSALRSSQVGLVWVGEQWSPTGWRGMGCITQCERTLDPGRGNKMTLVVTCLTQSLLPVALVDEGSIKACLILRGQGQKLGGSWFVLPLQGGAKPSHFSRDLVGLLITHCRCFVPPLSVSLVYLIL